MIIWKKINTKRLNYLNSYPSPTVSHMYDIELGKLMTDCMDQLLKENEWWIQNKDKGIQENDFKYFFGSFMVTEKHNN